MKRIHVNKRNPILPLDIHIPDCEAHVMPDGHLYLYGSYDQLENIFCSEEYVVVSTENMNKWTIHETALHGNSIPWFEDPSYPKYKGIDWTKPTPFIRKMMENVTMAEEKKKFEVSEHVKKPPLLFAPDCVYKNGMYYLYFCMSDESEGVAIADNPEGPFKNPKQLPCGGIDPAVFIDEDQKAYYYWGQLYSHGVQLNEDMTSFDTGNIVDDLVTEEEHFFHEGSSIRKIGDTYYMVYANIERGKPTSLGYSISKSPLGPFEYKGIIIDNDKCDPESWNNHGSIENFHGNWYIFYHRCSRGKKEYRRLCIEPIKILEDGSIPEVKMTSSGIGLPFGPGETIYGYQSCELNGNVRIDLDEEGMECLTSIENSDLAAFRYCYSPTGFNAIDMEYSGTGKIRICLDDLEIAMFQLPEGIVREHATSVPTKHKVYLPLKQTISGGRQQVTFEFVESYNLRLYSFTLI